MATAIWVPAFTALVGASIGVIGVLVGQAIDARRHARSNHDQELRVAVEEVLTCATAVDLRVHDGLLLAANAGSLVGVVSRVIGHSTPFDLAGTLDLISTQAATMERAAARVLLVGDERTVALTDAVVTDAMQVVNAHHQPMRGYFLNQVSIATLGRPTADADRVRGARNRLARSRSILTNHARTALRLSQIDRSAISTGGN